MIVRIMDEGQFEVPEERRDSLDKMDTALAESIGAGDEKAFRAALHSILENVRAAGRRLPDDYIGPSEFVLPHEGASRDEVQVLLSGTQEVPG